MDKKEKIIKLMELLGVIKSVKDELSVYRRTMCVRELPFEISDKEEECVIEAFIKVYEEEWVDETTLDRAIAFCESEEGQKIVKPTGTFLEKLNRIVPGFLEAKINALRQNPPPIRHVWVLPPHNTLQ